jgi:hypothetical protein
VTPEQTLWVVVGAGGVGVSGGNGGAASPSFVGPSTSPAQAYVRAAGGSGGTANTAGGSPPGGAGGTIANSVGQTRIAGANGEAGGTCFTSCSGGGGRGAYEGGYGGAGFCGAYITSDGNPGDPAGGGGGGSRTSQYNGARVGGAGAVGMVVITWQTGPVPNYNLTMAVSPVGAGTTNPTGTSSRVAGGAVSISAAPVAGCSFLYWTATAGTFGDANSATTTFTMPSQDVTVVAHFQCEVVPIYNLTMAVSPVGAGTTNPTGTSSRAAGDAVSISAAPVAGCSFLYWTATAGTFGDANSAATTFTMPSQNVTVVAHFQCGAAPYKLTIDSEAGGFVATPGEGVSDRTAGTVINLVATPLNGCYFEYWTATAGVFGNPWVPVTTFTMPAQNATIIAHFACVPVGTYTLTTAVSPPGSGTATDLTGASPYPAGATVSISAAAGVACTFVNWTAPAGTIANPNATTTTFTMPAQNAEVTANFVCDCPIISPPTRQYDLDNRGPVTTNITWPNGASSVTVRRGATYLATPADYTVTPNTGTATLTISNSYLQGQLTAAGLSIMLTIEFGDYDGCARTLVITAIDTSTLLCPIVSPVMLTYDLANPLDRGTWITWRNGVSPIAVRHGAAYLSPSHYTLSHSGSMTRLTILSSYLEGRLTAVDQSLELTVEFDDYPGCDTVLTITAIDEPVVVGFTGHPVNKLAVVTPWAMLLAAVAAGAGLLTLRRRRA